MVTVVFVLGLEHNWLTLPVIIIKKKKKPGLLLNANTFQMCVCVHLCGCSGGQTLLSPPFTHSCPANLLISVQKNTKNEIRSTN